MNDGDRRYDRGKSEKCSLLKGQVCVCVCVLTKTKQNVDFTFLSHLKCTSKLKMQINIKGSTYYLGTEGER